MVRQRGGVAMLAGGAGLARRPVAVHDALQDGGEGRDADAGRHQRRVLRAEDVRRRRAVRPVHVYLSTRGTPTHITTHTIQTILSFILC